ncbi:hypothetical protein [Chromobacterium vaccinii]|uniref:hypothetical protein n=1 Tax=Chromobacterium vaccinii TaxID=1108595 RepID=UPI001319C260|nr:hypothetical protein [Chromobacterium vaccinii]
MNRIEELKIKNLWKINMKNFASTANEVLSKALEKSEKLSIKDGSDWLSHILINKKKFTPIIFTKWEIVKLEILAEIRKEKYLQEGSIVSFSNYKNHKSDDGTKCLVSDLPIINNTNNIHTNMLCEIIEFSLPFFAFSNPDTSSGIIVTSCAALPTKENDMYDGVEYEIYKW